MIHRVFIVDLQHPCHKIREIEGEVVVCKKTSWIEHNGRRRLLGCSAFYTRKSAERCKIALLRKLLKNTVLANMFQTRHIYDYAYRTVAQYDHNGTVH